MPISLPRRGFLIGALFAPAVVRAASIMPVRDPGLVKGIWLGNNTFEPLDDNVSLNHETVWLHKSHHSVQEALGVRSRMECIAKNIGANVAELTANAKATASIAARRAAWLEKPGNRMRLESPTTNPLLADEAKRVAIETMERSAESANSYNRILWEHASACEMARSGGFSTHYELFQVMQKINSDAQNAIGLIDA